MSLILLLTGYPQGGQGASSNEQSILPQGVESASNIGSHTFTPGAVDISPAGITSSSAIGSHTFTVYITPTGIGSSSAIGSHTFTPGAVDIAPAGVTSSSSIGSHTFTTTGVQDIAPAGIVDVSTIGTHAFAIVTVVIPPVPEVVVTGFNGGAPIRRRGIKIGEMVSDANRLEDEEIFLLLT